MMRLIINRDQFILDKETTYSSRLKFTYKRSIIDGNLRSSDNTRMYVDLIRR